MENGRIIPRSASIKLDLKNAGSATFAEPAFFFAHSTKSGME